MGLIRLVCRKITAQMELALIIGGLFGLFERKKGGAAVQPEF
jgi:hypothetical protein